MRWWGRLRDLLRQSRVEQDIDDELRFHLESEFEAHLQCGLTPAEARRAAHDSLGGRAADVRERIHDVRGMSWVDDLRRDLRQGGRLLRRTPGATAVMACTLAVAIGGTVAAFSITDAWLFTPLRFPAADRLVVAFMATTVRPGEPAVWMPYRTYLSWRGTARAFSSVSAVFFHAATWRAASDAKSLVGMQVTPEFFATMQVPALRGRHFVAADAGGSPGVILSYGFWQRELGGDEGIVGRAVMLSDTAYTVVGVMPQQFDVRLLDRPEGAAYWVLFGSGERGYEPGGLGPVTIVGRLADDVTIEAARAEAAEIMRRAESAYAVNFNRPDATGGRLTLNLSSLQADNTRTVRSTLLTVLVAAVALLTIAAMNVGVMLLGRGLSRHGEVAVRSALGARRGRLVRQFLTESLLLSACGGVLGVAIAALAVRAFMLWNPLGTLPANGVALDLRTLAATVVGVALTTVVAGLVPSLRISASGIEGALRGDASGRSTAPAHRAQRAMLAAQIAVSTVLVVSAALLARTAIQLRGEPLGFSADDVTVAQTALPTRPFDSSAARIAFYEALEQQLLSRPGVRAVAASTSAPLAGAGFATVNLTAIDSVTAPRISTSSVSSTFFQALSIPVIAGRGFDGRDTADGPRVVALNARAAMQLYGDPAAAIGKRLRIDDEGFREVVGVVGNVRTAFFNTLEWRTEPALYRPAAQALARPADPAATHVTLWIHVRSDRPLAAQVFRDAVRTVGPRAAVLSVERVNDLVANATKQPTFRMTLLLWFCGASLLLAAIGVYGIVTQAVTERLREIAIRIALGAHPGELTRSFVRTAVMTGAVGLLIGVGVSLTLARAFESMLYGVHTSDAASLLMASALLLGVTGAAAWIPALRATRIDAVQVLRA